MTGHQRTHTHRRSPARVRALGTGVLDAVRPGLTRLAVGYAVLGAAIVAVLSR